jgi:anti-sigma regulatory factor (Ser/Thr protein kinase)
MILLRCIDFQRSCAEFVADSPVTADSVTAPIERSLGLARALALGEIRVLDVTGGARVFTVQNPLAGPRTTHNTLRPEVAGQAPAAVEVAVGDRRERGAVDAPIVWPQATVRDQEAEYRLRLAHAPESLRPLSAYVALVLATHSNWSEPLLQVRLALYEILANVLEHGRPLRTPTEVEVGLILEPRSVRGWIRDECVRFDPGAWRSVPVPDLVAGRSVRGYGMHLVGTILGTLEHSFDGTGNCLTFGKEVSQ